MIKRLTRTFTAAALCLSIALTTMAPNPAHAQLSDDEAIAGILTLLLLGAAIHHSRDRDDDRRATVTRSQPRPDWRVLPGNCIRTIRTRDRDSVRILTQRCLTNTYSIVNRLPERCRIRVRNEDNQVRQGFRPRCLRNAGFRINQR